MGPKGWGWGGRTCILPPPSVRSWEEGRVGSCPTVSWLPGLELAGHLMGALAHPDLGAKQGPTQTVHSLGVSLHCRWEQHQEKRKLTSQVSGLHFPLEQGPGKLSSWPRYLAISGTRPNCLKNSYK